MLCQSTTAFGDLQTRLEVGGRLVGSSVVFVAAMAMPKEMHERARQQ